MDILTEYNLVELPALEWLKEERWEYLPGNQLTPGKGERESFSDVILERRFLESLKKINPHIPEGVLEGVYKKLFTLVSPDLAHTNLNFHKLLLNGVAVEYKDSNGNLKSDIVKLVDFENLENNSFLAVNQFAVKRFSGEEGEGFRFDIVLFLNGLPVALFELKSALESVKKAYMQIQNYKELVPQIFYFNEVIVISNLFKTKIGSLTASYDRFFKWRGIEDKYDYKEGRTPSLEVLIKGLFNRERFLEYLRDFIVFDVDKEIVKKKIAMYHQFYDVRKAIKNTLNALSSSDRRIGTFWHTQGSGKSLSMVFYVRKAIKLEELKNPTVVILTDRTDLDSQLSKAFLRTELKDYVEVAESVRDLREKLNKNSGGIIFATIQKFQLTDKEKREGKRFPVVSDRKNIIVIADEAHRSQYKKLAQNVRMALPQAMFIGFTGTPIESDDRSTITTFGNYAGIYTMKQATEDKAIVPIYYQSRFSELHLSDLFLDLLDLEFENITAGIEGIQKEKLKKKFSALETLIRAPDRMKKIAKDIVNHFNSLELDTKAMVVCVSRAAAVEMYKYMKGQENCPEIAVVMSGSKSHDPPEFWEHIRNKQELKELAERFKNPEDPLKMVIVVDMWLTGFDAPVVSTMYIDKPMKNHALLQAIARVNRVYPGKRGGLIVDYIGITDDLRKSLSIYTKDVVEESLVPIDEAVSLMLEKYDIVRSYLRGINYENWKLKSNVDQARLFSEVYAKLAGDHEEVLEFLKQISALTKAYALVSTTEEAIKIRDDIEFFQNVARILRKYTSANTIDVSEKVEDAIKSLVNRAIKASNVKTIFEIDSDKDISVLDSSFLRYLDRVSNKTARVRIFEKLLKDELKVRLKRNQVKRKSFQKRLENIIRQYNNRVLTYDRVISQLRDLVDELRNIHACREKLGLTEEEEAFYDILISSSECQYDEKIIKIVKELTKKIKSELTVDWHRSEQSRAKVRRIIKNILRKYKFKKNPKIVELIFKQVRELYKDYPFVA